MKTKELVILTAIIIVALIFTFVITNYVQANPTTSHYGQTINAGPQTLIPRLIPASLEPILDPILDLPLDYVIYFL